MVKAVTIATATFSAIVLPIQQVCLVPLNLDC